MDTRLQGAAHDPVVVTGAGAVVLAPAADARACDPTEFLPVRKNRKFMGLQDDLAVVAAGRALRHARLDAASLGERAGLYLAVGYIPFEQGDIDALAGGSTGPDGFSMQLFSTTGVRAVRPLITFRCLPNMPAYHVSASFDLQGPYFVTYPGVGQMYVALQEACADLNAGRIDRALVGGVADQRNFLVTHHFGRVIPASAPESLADGAAFLVLEREDSMRTRPGCAFARLMSCAIDYTPVQPFREGRAHREWCEKGGEEEHEELRMEARVEARVEALVDAREGKAVIETGALGAPLGSLGSLASLGPASLPALVAQLARTGPPWSVRHCVESRDGITARSTWAFA